MIISKAMSGWAKVYVQLTDYTEVIVVMPKGD
jgi:hypothetical protein